MHNILRTGRSTNFKLGTQSMKTHITDKRCDLQGQGRKVMWCSWQVLADNREQNVLETCKCKVTHPTGNNAHQFQEGQGHHVD